MTLHLWNSHFTLLSERKNTSNTGNNRALMKHTHLSQNNPTNINTLTNPLSTVPILHTQKTQQSKNIKKSKKSAIPSKAVKKAKLKITYVNSLKKNTKATQLFKQTHEHISTAALTPKELDTFQSCRKLGITFVHPHQNEDKLEIKRRI